MEELIKGFVTKCQPLSFKIGRLITWDEIANTNNVRLYFARAIYAKPGIVSSYQTRCFYMTQERINEIDV